MDIKKYLEEKKDNVTKKAKQVALTGLAAATILGGVAGLTSCDHTVGLIDTSAQETTISAPSTTLEPATQDQIDRVNAAELGIEEFFKDKKDDFDVNYIVLNKIAQFDGELYYSYSMLICQVPDEKVGMNALAEASINIDEDLFNQIYALYQNGSSNIKEDGINLPGEIMLEMYNDAIKDGHNADIMELIYNEIKTNQDIRFRDYEAEMDY